MSKFDRNLLTVLVWTVNVVVVILIGLQMVQAANCHSVVCQ